MPDKSLRIFHMLRLVDKAGSRFHSVPFLMQLFMDKQIEVYSVGYDALKHLRKLEVCDKWRCP